MTSIAFPVVAGTVALVFLLSSLESRWVKGFLSWLPVILFAYIVPAILLKHQVLILAAWLRLLRRLVAGTLWAPVLRNSRLFMLVVS